MFGLLHEPELEDFAREERLSLWRLWNTVTYSLLPFSDPMLRIPDQLTVLDQKFARFSSIVETATELRDTAYFLFENGYNPKRDHVIVMLSEPYAFENSEPIGIVCPPSRFRVRGWDSDTLRRLTTDFPFLRFIDSRAGLQSRLFKQIILPHGGTNCPFFVDLYYGYRASRIDVVVYKHESYTSPVSRTLPRPGGPGSHGTSSGVDGPLSRLEKSVEGEAVEREYWEAKRRAALSMAENNDGADEDSFVVSARLMLLAANRMVYLASDKKELVSSEEEFDSDGGFAYRPVPEIREGDYVVFRTGRSTDIVRAIAERMMTTDGENDLYSGAFDWKTLLLQALNTVGHEELGERLMSNGQLIRSSKYIWMWTTDLVMRPQSPQRFKALIEVIQDVVALNTEEPVDDFIHARWRMMNTIEDYHRRAGQYIRRHLLKRLNSVLQEADSWEDEYHITLTDDLVGAEISVFKMLAVDGADADVPPSLIGKVLNDNDDL